MFGDGTANKFGNKSSLLCAGEKVSGFIRQQLPLVLCQLLALEAGDEAEALRRGAQTPGTPQAHARQPLKLMRSMHEPACAGQGLNRGCKYVGRAAVARLFCAAGGVATFLRRRLRNIANLGKHRLPRARTSARPGLADSKLSGSTKASGAAQRMV